MTTEGRQRVCDRCGTTVFEPKSEEKATVDGYTRWNLYDEAVGWGSSSDFSDLCPKCMAQWDKMITNFKNYSF